MANLKRARAKATRGTSRVPPVILSELPSHDMLAKQIMSENSGLDEAMANEIASDLIRRGLRMGVTAYGSTFLRQLRAASIEVDRAVLSDMASPDKPGRSLRRIERWNDLLPTVGLRKQTKKMIADQQAHIEELVKQKRTPAARWQVACTWGTWCWYVLKRPITELSKSLQGKVGK